MARNDVYLNINALSPADAVVTGQQDMTAATVPELVLGDTPTFNFYFTDNTNVWPSWAGNAAYTVTWALSDAVSGDFSPAATTGNATPITGGWSVVLPLNAYDLVGLLNTKRVSQPYPVTNLWQQIRVADPSGNEITRAMFWTPVRYRAISDTQNTESASPTGGREVTVDNVNVLTTPTAAQFYAANPVPTSALGSAANGELLIGNGTGFTKATLTAGSGVSITNGAGSITISATDGDITLDDGTAAAPSLKFTADTDTGIYRPSDNVLGISAGGVSRATFGATSAINGTTIPSSKTLVVTTDKLSALAATTSAELAGVISDETGSGALVFATSPTLVTPNIGAATGTSFNLSGSGTLGTTLTVNSTTDSSSKDTGAIVTEGGLGVEKSASIGGNLTVSGGTITNSGSTTGIVSGIATNSNASGYSGWGVANTGTSGRWWTLGVGGSTVGNTAIRNTLYIYDETATATRWTMDTSGNISQTGNLTVSGGTISSGSGTLTLNSSANTVVLQSAGATALTLDSSQNATFAGSVTTTSQGSGTNAGQNTLFVYANTSGTPVAGYGSVIRLGSKGIDGGAAAVGAEILTSLTGGTGASQYNSDLILKTRNGGSILTALTLDTSQNATFAGKITSGTWADVVSARLGIATSANSYAATIANNASSGGAYALRLHTTGTASSDYIVVGSSGASAGSIRFLADGAGNFVVNNAAIATNATDGFLYVSTCAGTPTGTPTSYTGRAPIVVDTTNNKLYFYSGGQWRDAGP